MNLIKTISLVGLGFAAAFAVAITQGAAPAAPASNLKAGTTRAQHLAARVSNLERSIRFYTEVLPGAKAVVKPYRTPKEMAEGILGPGAGYRAAFVELSDGFILELFEFVSPPELVQSPINMPKGKGELNLDGFMHFGIQVAVDDLDAALDRAVAAGGRVPGRPASAQSAPPRPRPARGYGSTGAKYVYVLDPDGNIIELNDTSQLVTEALQMLEMNPDPRPQ